MHSAQAYTTIAGCLREARENKGFLSTAVFTLSIHGQAEGCSAFLKDTKLPLKNTPFSIIIFYVMKVTSLLSYAAVTFLSQTFNSCHCTLLLHSLAQEQPITAQQCSRAWGSRAGAGGSDTPPSPAWAGGTGKHGTLKGASTWNI